MNHRPVKLIELLTSKEVKESHAFKLLTICDSGEIGKKYRPKKRIVPNLTKHIITLNIFNNVFNIRIFLIVLTSS